MNVAEKVKLIKQGLLSSEKLCEECIADIEKNDKEGKGLNAIAMICEDWRAQARALDQNPDKDRSNQYLYGIPVLVKDNIEVKGTPNTAGSYVLRDNISKDDSFLVKCLREQGAVILGKCNLSEFAYWMSEDGMPSGYSSLSGQVIHPYNPSFDPSGSSSGSAVAVAARYCDLAVGTETDGSLMSPAISNGIVSIKPTLGLISRNGILPLSHVQDSAGPMANSVEDCVVLLQSMAVLDPSDPAFKNAEVNNYFKELKKDLSGKRIGVFTMEGYEHNAEYLDYLKDLIEENHGEVVEIELKKAAVDEYECLFYEFKEDINAYLARQDCKARCLKDIIRMNEENKEKCLRYGQSLLIKSEEKPSLEDEEYQKLRQKISGEAERILNETIDENKLSCLVTICHSAAFNLAAVSGACSMTLPAREINEVNYDPLSFYLLGKKNKEGELIRLAYTLEKSMNLVVKPSWLKDR